VGDQASAGSKEVTGLRNHPFSRGGRFKQFSGCRKYGRREFLFETAGEQPFQNVLGGTQVGDLFFSHGNHLMFGRRTRHLVTADPTGLSVSEGGNAGDEPVSSPTCLAVVPFPLALISGSKVRRQSSPPCLHLVGKSAQFPGHVPGLIGC
jgi:hypothetical protein